MYALRDYVVIEKGRKGERGSEEVRERGGSHPQGSNISGEGRGWPLIAAVLRWERQGEHW